ALGVVGGVDLAAVLAVSARRRRHEVVAELLAKRLEQTGVALAARGRVAREAALVRVLPVDVDAVEDIGPAGVLDHVTAGLGERSSRRVGSRSLRESTGPGPATHGEEHLEVRVLRLELAELVEVAAQRLVPRVGLAVDRLV